MTRSQTVSVGRKFDQVVRGATAVFLREGYAGASVDDIASAAQVSKATLYSYFPDKPHMFRQAMREGTARLDGSFTLDIAADLPPEEGIPLIAARVAEWLTDPVRIDLFRLHAAEALRFGTLSGDFHDTVIQILHDAIRPHLDHWAGDGRLRLDDTKAATSHLIVLSSADLMARLLFGRQAVVAPADVAAAARAAADLFLCAALPAEHPGLRRIG